MTDTNLVLPEKSIEPLVGKSIMITGPSGVGKTRTLKRIIINLIKTDKKVFLIDLKNEYSELDNLKEVETIYDTVHLSDMDETKYVYRFVFSGDPFAESVTHDMKFLHDIGSIGFDYLIIDEFNHFLTIAKNLMLSELLSESNLNKTKMIFALQRYNVLYDSLSKEDNRQELLKIKYDLIFKERNLAVLTTKEAVQTT